MNRIFLAFTALMLTLASALPAAESPPPSAKPNIIVILTDDQGYGDFSGTGNPILKTPQMDRLHDEGVRFTDFHDSPTCSPTRSALPWDPGSADPFGSGSQSPKPPEALMLPADHGVWLHEDQGVGPTAPDLPEEYPKCPVSGPEFRSWALLFEDRQWLAQGQVLHYQLQPGPEQQPGKSDHQCQHEANHTTSIARGPPMDKSNAFPDGSPRRRKSAPTE